MDRQHYGRTTNNQGGGDKVRKKTEQPTTGNYTEEDTSAIEMEISGLAYLKSLMVHSLCEGMQLLSKNVVQLWHAMLCNVVQVTQFTVRMRAYTYAPVGSKTRFAFYCR